MRSPLECVRVVYKIANLDHMFIFWVDKSAGQKEDLHHSLGMAKAEFFLSLQYLCKFVTLTK